MMHFNKLFLLSDRKTQVCLISCSFTENILCTALTDSCPSVFTFQEMMITAIRTTQPVSPTLKNLPTNRKSPKRMWPTRICKNQWGTETHMLQFIMN